MLTISSRGGEKCRPVRIEENPTKDRDSRPGREDEHKGRPHENDKKFMTPATPRSGKI